MAYRQLPLSSLVINPSNDRHGELENETAAISQLFSAQEQHMRNLAKDLTIKGEVFEPPLVFPRGSKFIVADGNRRTTCLKLLVTPRRAPTVELQHFFSELRANWHGKLPEKIECRVETDRERVDDILFRRHTGVQGGVGQSKWTDRMKNNFVIRKGKASGINVSDEIEKVLQSADMLPHKPIPRSNLNRLLSSEAIRNRLGISFKKGSLEFTRDQEAALRALQRVASDLAYRKVTLDDIWDAASKTAYVDKLEQEGTLPSLVPSSRPPDIEKPRRSPRTEASAAPAWPHVIPNLDYGVEWTARLHRHQAIWEELQYRLHLSQHPNAISVLMRVLLELSIDHYIQRMSLVASSKKDGLGRKYNSVALDMKNKGIIDDAYFTSMNKMRDGEGIVSLDTLHSYIHSPRFAVSPEHLKMIWATLADFIVYCLKAKRTHQAS